MGADSFLMNNKLYIYIEKEQTLSHSVFNGWPEDEFAKKCLIVMLCKKTCSIYDFGTLCYKYLSS